MNNKIDSLKTLQSIIGRLERNSFANKGWLIVLISTLVTVSYTQPLLRNNLWSTFLFTIIIVLFWLCDAYYKGLVQWYRDLSNDLAGELEGTTNHIEYLQKIKGVDYWTQYKLARKNLLKGDVAPFYISLLAAMMFFIFATPRNMPTPKPVPVDSVFVKRQIDSLKFYMADSIEIKIDAQAEITASIRDSLSRIISKSQKPKILLPPCVKYVRMNVCQDTIIHKADLVK